MPATPEQCRKYRQKLKQRAFSAIGTECVFCHEKDGLHAAHVKPTACNGMSRGQDRRFRDVIKNPDAYRPMCPECHKVFDALTSLLKEEKDEVAF